MLIQIEITDTFAGEANYSWRRRSSLELPDNKSDTAIIRAVKKAIGWNNLRTRTDKFGEMIQLTPFHDCMTCFISFDR